MNNNDKWLRYCDLLFSDDSLGFWLDISRMNVEKSDFEKFKNVYSKAFDSIESLENGSIANIDEIISIIKKSKDPKKAADSLCKKTWKSGPVEAILKKVGNDTCKPKGISKDLGLKGKKYKLSSDQARAIFGMTR